MSLHKHRTPYKRGGYLPPSGSVVENDPTPTASLLVQDTTAVAGPDSTAGIPLVSTSIADNASTAGAHSSTPTASGSSSSSSGSHISLGTAIGACIAALIALLLAVALAFYCSKRQNQITTYSRSRNAANDASRKRSHFTTWKRMDDNGDQCEGQEGRERPARQRPPSEPLGAMFHRTLTNTSGEKSSEGHNRESIGTMRHFAKYHPDLAAEMASQGAVTGVDGEVAKPPPVLHPMGRGLDMSPPLSLDGDTLGGDSLMSYPDLSNSMSSHMMATAKSTPLATFSSLHRWERAEVVHVRQVDSDSSEVRQLHNPFSDSANAVRSGLKGQNPFFSARDYPVRSTLLPGTHKEPAADTSAVRESPSTIRSLIAALEEPQGLDSNNRIVSVQSSVYSRLTEGDGDSAISVAAFPYPPSLANLR